MNRPLAHYVSWRYCLTLLALCFVLSTEVLFSPGTFAQWTPAQIADGWLEVFADTLCLGLCAMLAVAGADRLLPPDGNARLASLVAVVVLAGCGGYAALTVYHYPAGYYPPLLVLVGEALRAVLLAVMLTLVWAVQRRNARALQRIGQLELNSAALQRRMLEAQLKVMEAQIEPHFLFNTLATVKCLYQSGTAGGERMLASLGLYLGAALPQFRGDGATLASECALAGAYLDILQIRMGHRLRFAIDLPAALAGQAFPPMILVTLVENAIKHGLGPSAEGGRIDIAARARDGVLTVSVADDGVGFQASCGSGIGLVNIRARLQALYGAGAALHLRQNLPHGVVASVTLPLRHDGADAAPAVAPSAPPRRRSGQARDRAGLSAWPARLRARRLHILLLGLAIAAMDELRKLPADLEREDWLGNLLGGAMITLNSVLMAALLILAITLAELASPPRWRVPALALAVGLGAPLTSMLALQLPALFNQLGVLHDISDYYGLFIHALWSALATGALAAAYFSVWERAQRSAARLWAARLEQAEAERQMVEARLNVMKARIEPAFLIRETARIQALYRHDAARAAQQLDHLIAYLQAALPRIHAGAATLGDELALAAAYLRLQAGVRSAPLAWRFEVAEEWQALPFPPMALLPLIDDALRRAALAAPAPLLLQVRLAADARRFSVTFEDNGGAAPDGDLQAALAQHALSFRDFFAGSGSVTRDRSAGATRVTMAADIGDAQA
jgi:LytS/YehU family sensor histidine kinase